MKINRDKFFSVARELVFDGQIKDPKQVEGLNRILDYWESWPDKDLRRLSYVLATVHWETGKTFQPVREAYWLSENWRKNNLRYYPYYGRGDVQLTWKENYIKMGNLLGINLVDNPDKALDPSISVQVLFEGMYKAESGLGDFTQQSLDQYFNDTVDDPKGARKIVNGTDKDDEIAAIYEEYLVAVKQSVEQTTQSPQLTIWERFIKWLVSLFSGG